MKRTLGRSDAPHGRAAGLFLAGGAAAQPAGGRRKTGAGSASSSSPTRSWSPPRSTPCPSRSRPSTRTHREEMPSLALEPEFPVRGPERRFMVDRLLPFPFRELPRSEAELKAKYGEKADGIGRLPWLVQESYARLVEAMKAGDKEKILAESDVLAGLVVDLHSAAQPHRELRRPEDRPARPVGAARREAPPGPRQGPEGLARRRELPRQPEGVRLLHDARAPTSGSTTRSTSRSSRGGASPATATPTSRTSPARSGRSSARAPRRARPRTRAATGTRRGRWPGGPS